MLLRHAIGLVLRRTRTERGATLRQLSEQSMISIPYLSEIERGRKEASSEILATLCRVLDISERELLVAAAATFVTETAPEAPVISLIGEKSQVKAGAATVRAAAPLAA